MEKYWRISLRRAFVIFGVNIFHSYIYILVYPRVSLLMAHLPYHQAAGHTVLYVGATDAEALVPLVGLGKVVERNGTNQKWGIQYGFS